MVIVTMMVMVVVILLVMGVVNGDGSGGYDVDGVVNGCGGDGTRICGRVQLLEAYIYITQEKMFISYSLYYHEVFTIVK